MSIVTTLSPLYRTALVNCFPAPAAVFIWACLHCVRWSHYTFALVVVRYHMYILCCYASVGRAPVIVTLCAVCRARVMRSVMSVFCKIATTCRDYSKTKWKLHSVDLTSTELSSPGQDIIHSSVAKVCVDDWCLKSLKALLKYLCNMASQR